MKDQKDKSSKPIAHVVSHTHWDREWRYPIWETRLMLIDFMDELIEVLEAGIYPGFLFDGQVSAIYDYLEFRPEMAERIKALVASGKLQIGPWWILPDEYPIDGESMVRNLLKGTRRAKALGGLFNIGYTSFGWGQTAQLPQIYAGFGIDLCMVGKRVSNERAPKSEFIWRAPDGSQLLTTRFGAIGRNNFFLTLHLSALFGVNHLSDEWRYNWPRPEVAYHRADREQMEQDHYQLEPPRAWHPEMITPKMINQTWATTDESVLPDDRLMMNGCDYSAAQKFFPAMLERINEVDPDHTWVHTTMPEFIEIMRAKIDPSSLAIVEGELRDGPAKQMTGNAMTTRLYLKRLNKQAQNALIRFAEPMNMLAAMMGEAPQYALLDHAWEELLAAHPHDSINGVTQDKTVMDVTHRLNQVIELSQALGNRAMQQLIRKIDIGSADSSDVFIVAFNPLPYFRSEVLEAYVTLPGKMPDNPDWFHDMKRCRMFDAEGNAVGTQWLGASNEAYATAEIHTRALPYTCQRHRVLFQTGEIPACGYKVFKAGFYDPKDNTDAPWGDLLQQTGTLLKSPHVIENDFLCVEMNPNGTFNLTDKTTARTFANLNYYQDRGEIGDYWNNQRPVHDQVFTSLGCAARIWSEFAGPLAATLVSEITMQIPRNAVYAEERRSTELTDLTIRTSVTLRRESKAVEVNVEFENRHEDHYLRVMFPTGLSGATHADAGGHFCVDHRPIRPQGPNPRTTWLDMAALPQSNFVDVSDGQAGIAFLNDSLTEYEVMDNDERTVALSLLRAVRNWVCTEIRVGSGWPSQKGGQCLGNHQIRYALQPHSGDWESANIPLAAERFNAAPRLVQTNAHEGSLPGTQLSLLSIDNPLLRFASLKKAEDRDTTILRLYNPTGKSQEATLRLQVPIASAWLADLNETRMTELEVGPDNTIALSAGAYKIVTIEVETK